MAHKLLQLLNLSQQFVCWSANRVGGQRFRAYEIMRQLIAVAIVVAIAVVDCAYWLAG